MTPEEGHEIARGRPWSGVDAHERGLVDHLGGLAAAVAAAAELAGLGEDYGVEYRERELDLSDQLLLSLVTKMSVWWAPEPARVRLSPFSEAVDFVEEQMEQLRLFNDPRGLYAHCLCEVY